VEHLKVLDRLTGVFVTLRPVLEGLDPLQDLLSFVWIVPEFGVLGQFFVLLDLFELPVDVKDTPLAP
jgi:hypothetical protein